MHNQTLKISFLNSSSVYLNMVIDLNFLNNLNYNDGFSEYYKHCKQHTKIQWLQNT